MPAEYREGQCVASSVTNQCITLHTWRCPEQIRWQLHWGMRGTRGLRGCGDCGDCGDCFTAEAQWAQRNDSNALGSIERGDPEAVARLRALH